MNALKPENVVNYVLRDKIVAQEPYACEFQPSMVYYLDKVVNVANYVIMGVRHMKISKGRSMIITGMKEEFQQNKCC
jgi:hypothetical protein